MSIRVPESVLKTSDQNPNSKPLIIKQRSEGVDLERLRDLTDATLVGALDPDNLFEPKEVRVDVEKLDTLVGRRGSVEGVFGTDIKDIREAATVLARAFAFKHGISETDVNLFIVEVLDKLSFNAPQIAAKNIASNVVAELVRFRAHEGVLGEITDLGLLPRVFSQANEYAEAHNISLSDLAGQYNEGEYLERIIKGVQAKLQEAKEQYLNQIRAEAKSLKEQFVQAKDRMTKSLSSVPEEQDKLKAIDSITLLATKVLELIEKEGAILDREKGHVKSLFQAIVEFGNQITQKKLNPYSLKKPESLDRVEFILRWFQTPGFNRLYTYKLPQAELDSMRQSEAPVENATPRTGDAIVGTYLSCPDPRNP